MSSAAKAIYQSSIPPVVGEGDSELPSLYFACSSRNWEEAERLVDAGVGLNFRRSDGRGILHCFIEKNAPLRLAEKVLQAGADPNMPDKWAGNTPVHYAAKSNTSPNLLRLLFQYGGDVNRESAGKTTPLDWAADQNVSTGLFKALLEAGADARHVDSKLWTPLHWIVRVNGRADSVRLLIEYGNDPNAVDSVGFVSNENAIAFLTYSTIQHGYSPLYYAVEMVASQHLIAALLRHGGRLDDNLFDHVKRKGNLVLKEWLEKVRLMLILCSVRSIPRLKRSVSPLRMLPSDLCRSVSHMLY